jgi:hypothetical protein
LDGLLLLRSWPEDWLGRFWQCAPIRLVVLLPQSCVAALMAAMI